GIMSADRKSFFESLDSQTRRSFLKLAAMAGVSSSMLLTGPSIVLAGDKENDVKIMNVALGLEHQAIAAYQAGAETKLLSDGVLKVAVKFQDHHKQHRDALASTVKKFGGKPVDAQAKYDPVAIAKSVGVNQLAAERDIIQLAAKLEAQATSAYLGAIPGLASKDVVKAALSIMADEAQHTAVLRSALGEDPVPAAFVS
ncbi:MAG: ferritin-like domain-containing protein, partial [Acidobacteriota bacterium]